MALADLTDPEAVRNAIVEFDERGREAFLDEYGFTLAASTSTWSTASDATRRPSLASRTCTSTAPR